MQNFKASDKIIGGMFGLQARVDPGAGFPPFLQEKTIRMANARSCIWFLAEHLNPGQVWCPSYLCHTILNAISHSHRKIKFYEVNYDLEITSLEWIKKVNHGDLVISVDYFGFIPDPHFLVEAGKRGAWILEDASQALLTDSVGQNSNFVVYSPRKFLGVPDGGILSMKGDSQLPDTTLENLPNNWWLNAFLASVLRREFDFHGGTREWFELFQSSEYNAPIGPYKMSDLTEGLILNSFDYSTISRHRIKNYQTLSEKLGNLALFPILPDRTVPLGYPIRTNKRDVVRRALFENNIYPPVHWSIQKTVPLIFKESHRLSTEIMTLPCDQRYNDQDMARISELVLKALE
jgi:dTDP-4-amino-4,6-dideoxygalactose transaminase